MTLDPPSPSVQWTFRRVMGATLILVLVVLGFWLLYRFHQAVFILFVAILMGTVIRPVVTWLHRRGMPRTAGVLLVYLLLLALLTSFVLLLFPLIIEQSATIAAAVPGYYTSLRDWMAQFPNLLMMRLSEFLPATLPSLEPLLQTGQEVKDSVGQALDYASVAAEVVLVGLVILALAFYWTIDGSRTIRSLLSLVPPDQRESIGDLISAMETKVGSYLAGQGILCLAIGVLALVAYLLIGLPNALVLALVAGVLEAVPMVGPLLGAIPAAVIALSVAPSKLIWVIVATLVIQQMENIVLVPRVMRKAVGVNPFVSLLAFFAFSSLLGMAGALMAIPTVAILQLLLDHFVFHPGVTEAEESVGRDYASRLRYEAQGLAQDLRKQARLNKGGSDLKVRQIDQVMDEIEAITTDLDALLSQPRGLGAP
ncbi:MAG: AI-2E family transporter [Anaerolineaceae bacterium]|nr:AI-2E family transporter [Anaerolineaceae bacterium]